MPDMPFLVTAALVVGSTTAFAVGMVLMLVAVTKGTGRTVRIAGSLVLAAGVALVFTGPWFLNVAYLLIGLGFLVFADTLAARKPDTTQ